MSREKAIAQPQISDEIAEVSGWLNMFPDTADQAVVAQEIDSPSIPFSEWCVIPVALLIIIGDMLFQFFGH